MQDVSIHRLSPCAAGPIFLLVEKESTRERTATMLKDKYPTGEELYALELWARRERDRALARAFVAGAVAVKRFLGRGLAFALRGPSARTIRAQVVKHA
jgi:hypothetical protein